MVLTHDVLLQILNAYADYHKGEAFVPVENTVGTCFAFMKAVGNARFLGQMEQFTKRLNLLAEYGGNPTKLFKKIEAIREKLKFDKKTQTSSTYVLTDKESRLLDVASFLEFLLYEQAPHLYHPDLLPREQLPRQGEPQVVLPESLRKPDRLQDEEKLSVADLEQKIAQSARLPTSFHRSFHAMTEDEMTHFFERLKPKLIQSENVIDLQFGSPRHAMSVSFQTKTDRWAWSDINFLGKNESGKKQYFPDYKPVLASDDDIDIYVYMSLRARANVGESLKNSPYCVFSLNCTSITDEAVLAASLAEILGEYVPDECDRVDARGISKLMMAAGLGDISVVQSLCEAGASLNLKDMDGVSALGYALNGKFFNVCHLLIREGADIEWRNHFGFTLLHQTMSLGCGAFADRYRENLEDLVGLFIEKGVSVDAVDNQGNTALRMAAESGQVGVVKRLLASGADCNISDNLGNSPLMYALLAGHNEIIELLIEAGADVNARNHWGVTPIVCLAVSDCTAPLAILKRLDEGGVYLKSATVKGNTALSAALLHDNIDIATALIEKSVDLDFIRADGLTPLMIACQKGQYKMVATLLVKGAKDIETSAGNARKIAKAKGFHQIESLLSEHFREMLPEPQPIPVLHETPTLIAIKACVKEIDDFFFARGQKESIFSVLFKKPSEEENLQYKLAQKLKKSLHAGIVSYSEEEVAVLSSPPLSDFTTKALALVSIGCFAEDNTPTLVPNATH